MKFKIEKYKEDYLAVNTEGRHYEMVFQDHLDDWEFIRINDPIAKFYLTRFSENSTIFENCIEFPELQKRGSVALYPII